MKTRLLQTNLLLALTCLTGAAIPTNTVVSRFGDDGWYSDDTRDSAGANLVGLTNTHYGKPGQTPTAADDTAIAGQIQFTPDVPDYRTALMMTKSGPGASKCSLSKVNESGFAVSAGGASWADGFTMDYGYYTTNTAELPVPKIGIRSTLWGTGAGQSQSGFTAIRSGESVWDLVLVDWRGSTSGWSNGGWGTFTADGSTNCWRVFRQAGNTFFNTPPASALSLVELVALNDTNNPAHVACTIDGTAYTWGQVLFGDGAAAVSIQIGVGSSAQTSTGYIDYLKLSILNGGGYVDFNHAPQLPAMVSAVTGIDTNATMYGAVRYKVLNLGGGSDREVYLGHGDLGVGTNRHERDVSWSRTNVIVLSYDPITGVESTTVTTAGGTVTTNYTVGSPLSWKPVDYILLGIRDSGALTPVSFTVTDLNGNNLGTSYSAYNLWSYKAITDPSLFQTGFVLTATLNLAGTGNCGECDKIEISFGNLHPLLTVTAVATNKVYGNSDPGLSYQITSGALDPGDTLSGAITRVAGEGVGNYQIQQGTLSGGGKYLITFVPADLTITQRPLTATADAQNKVYGEGDPALTYQITSGNLVNGDTLSGEISRLPGEDAGDYAIGQNTLTASTNYALTFVSDNLTIAPRTLLAKADDMLRVSGVTNPVFTITYTGFTNGEDAGVLDMPPTAGTLADTNSPVGAYAITLSGGSDNNYSLTLSNGILTVIAAETTPPVVSITSPGGGDKETNTITLTGTASDDTRIGQVWVKVNNGPFQSTAVTYLTPSSATWTILLSLDAGTNVVQVKAADLSGNETTITNKFFSVVRTLFTLGTTGFGSVSPVTGLQGTPTNGAMLKIDRRYTVKAVPAVNHLFYNWTRVDGGVTNVVVGAPAEYTFLMQSNLHLIANFVTNRFFGVAGAYLGLFSEPSGVVHHSSGFFKLRISTKGRITGTFWVGGEQFGMAGNLDPDGNCTAIPSWKSKRGVLTANLTVNMTGDDLITGTIQHTNGWIADLSGDRVVWRLPDNPATNFVGRYTMVIPGTNSSTSPAGDGYGHLIVRPKGSISFRGFTADGPKVNVRPYTPFPAPATVSKNGYWPFYATLYPGWRTDLVTGKPVRIFTGSALGWLHFTNGSLEGTLYWSKPASAGPYYPGGFTNEIPILASPYVKPEPGQRALNLTNGTVVLTGGNLTVAFTNNITWSSANLIKVTPTNLNSQSLEVVTSQGYITGEFSHPDLGNAVTVFRGALLQNQNVIRGFFLGTNQSGIFLLQGD